MWLADRCRYLQGQQGAGKLAGAEDDAQDAQDAARRELTARTEELGRRLVVVESIELKTEHGNLEMIFTEMWSYGKKYHYIMLVTYITFIQAFQLDAVKPHG